MASRKVIKTVSSSAFKSHVIDKWYRSFGGRRQAFLARRPHRSFRRTRRRDYVRSLQLPGYWALSGEVRRVLWSQRKLFLPMALIYCLLTILFVGIASQSTYTELNQILQKTGSQVFQGKFSGVGQAGLLLLTGVAGGFNTAPTGTQQIYAVILLLMAWLTTVWLLRNSMAGHRPKLRDGLYNAGAPILPTFLVSLVLIVQLLPVALAAIGFSAAVSTQLLNSGIPAMLFWAAALLLCALSLYWITGTLMALIIITLPGMYPLQALKTAGDLVVGRRLRIIYRIMWLVGLTAIIWMILMIPIILFDSLLNHVWSFMNSVPLIPLSLLALSSITVIWFSGYIYVLYRKVVDDDAKPA